MSKYLLRAGFAFGILGMYGCTAGSHRIPDELDLISERFEVRVVDEEGADPSPDDLICERRAAIGSRIRKVHCITRAEFEADQRYSEFMLRRTRDTSNANRLGN